MLGLVKTAGSWLLGKGAAALGLGGKALGVAAVGGAGYVGYQAATHERGLQGFVSDIVDPAAQITGGAGPEASFASFYKFIQKLGEFFQMLGVPGIGTAMANFGKNGVAGNVTPEERAEAAARELADKPLNSPERAAQRIYEHGAAGDADARYRIDGPGGSPPSVELSDAAPSVLNTVSLGLKGVKDGLGVAAGGVAGTIGWVADFVGLDGSFGANSEWGSSAYKGVAGAVNETTDFLAYDVIGKTAGTAVGGISGMFNGKGLVGGAVEGFQTDYEPTIRNEFDRSVYGVTSTVSGIAVGAVGGSFLTGAFAVNAAGAATLAEAAAAPLATTQLGAGILASKAGSLASLGMTVLPGVKPATP